MTPYSRPSNNTIATVCIVLGAALTVFIFQESRNDPGLRMAALVFASNVATAIVAISSLLLTGKDTTGNKEVPAGGNQTDISMTTTQAPPVSPAP